MEPKSYERANERALFQSIPFPGSTPHYKLQEYIFLSNIKHKTILKQTIIYSQLQQLQQKLVTNQVLSIDKDVTYCTHSNIYRWMLSTNILKFCRIILVIIWNNKIGSQGNKVYMKKDHNLLGCENCQGKFLKKLAQNVDV